jgi:transposase-like protein
MAEISYRRHRFPPVVVQPAVWLYLRFTLSYRDRDVEELLPSGGSTSLTRPSGVGC